MAEVGRLLVVDDTPYVREILHEYFTDIGYRVDTVEDGEQAFETLGRERPDVVLLDLMMPRIDGIDVLTGILLMDPALPVVVLTASTDELLARHLIAHGAFDFVPKPFDFDALERVVTAAVARRDETPGKSRSA